MTLSEKQFAKIWLLGLILISGMTFAASAGGRCPTCQSNYLECSWNCFASNGWQPVCAGFLTTRQQSLHLPADPSSYGVYASLCDANCYLNNYKSMYHYDGLAPTFKSNANSSCEQLWKVQAAFILQSLQSSGATVKVPAWLQSVAATKPTSIDYAALDACLSCTPPKAPPPKLPSPPSPPLSPSPSLSPLPSPAPSPKAAQGPSTSPQPTAPTSGASPYPISPPPSLSVSPSNAGSPTPPPSSGASAMSARIITIIMSIIVHYVIQ